MDKVITYNLGEDFIANVSDFIISNFKNDANDFSRIALCFGGKRPNLFLQRALSKRLKAPFYPPKVFSIDEFMEYIVKDKSEISKIGGLDACYFIYSLVKDNFAQILKGRESFHEFLPWAEEFISFIEQLDLENIANDSLSLVQKSANIGFDVPESVNALLQNVISLRQEYHKALKGNNKFSRGLVYLSASKLVDKKSFPEFDAIIFCNFFYIHATELDVIRSICKRDKGICIFQGDESQWSVLKSNAKKLGISLKPTKQSLNEPKIIFRTGFDLHSQVCFARETLKEIKEQEDTVIVLPQAESVVPLLSEISAFAKNINISMGYPLKRSSIFALFEVIFKAGQTRKASEYYTKDYLDVLRHPLVKNIDFSEDASVTRVLVHKIEEVLTGKIKTDIGGSLFIPLAAIEELDDIYRASCDTLLNMGISANVDELKGIVKNLHKLFFNSWDKVNNFFEFSFVLSNITNVLLEKSMIGAFSFNLKIIERIILIKEELQALKFCREQFSLDQMCEIFLYKLKNELISFSGSPLKGLQILGLFETRSLNFKNVIIMDVNEGVLPKLKIYEPLIPREVMLSLGLNRLEKEEEIQRYQFMSLIRAAEQVYIIYEENQAKEKSRFVEELIWKKQKQQNKLDVPEALKGVFSLKLKHEEPVVTKTSDMIEFLKKQRYSASRLNTYLECPLQFYYKYVLGLVQAEDLLDEPGSADVGNFIHELLEETFKKFINKKPIIDQEFKDYFWRVFNDKFSANIEKRMKSDSLLLKGIIENRLEKFLEEEAGSKICKILYLEGEFRGELKLPGMEFDFIMKVDRIDEYEDRSLAIIDYKTGKIDKTPKALKYLEAMGLTRESIRENIKSFQLPLYYYFVKKQFADREINAELYSIRTLERKAFIQEQDYGQKERIMEICLQSLEAIFKEIFDPNVSFIAEKDENRCKNCEFTRMCR
ncbi:MAG: PD-(D/E)XK nuclease family protein [Candidatus Omnitrophota bacterium]